MSPRGCVWRLSFGLLVSIIGSYLAVCAYFWFGQERLIFHPERLSDDYRFQFAWVYEEVPVRVEGGVSLDALLFHAAESKGVVFFVHGNAGNLQNNCRIAGFYLEQNYDFFCFDYRGFGKSGGYIASEAQLHRDVSRAYAVLLERYPEKTVVVVGSSLGTAPAAKVACGGHPRHLVLTAPYWSMLDVGHEHHPITRALPASLLRYPLRTHVFLENCRVPVTIIHGTADDTFPIEHSKRLVGLSRRDRFTLFEVPGARHNVSDTPGYRDAVRQILSAAR